MLLYHLDFGQKHSDFVLPVLFKLQKILQPVAGTLKDQTILAFRTVTSLNISVLYQLW